MKRKFIMKCVITAFYALVASQSFAASFTQPAAPTHTPDYVTFHPEYSDTMLDHTNMRNRKRLWLLDHKKSGALNNYALYIGARAIGLIDYQRSNRPDKFGYLMRHPGPTNHLGKTVSEAVLHSFQFHVTGNLASWFSLYGSFLYDPQQSFGAGTITSLTRNQVQLRKGYVLVGDLNMYPVYAALGKIESPFGLGDTVSPFTKSLVAHAFGGLAYGFVVGYYDHGLDASVMIAQGGSQFRAMNMPVKNSAVPSRLNNVVLDANYTFHFKEMMQALFGASYVRGSTFCHEFPVQHFVGCRRNNPAYGLYTQIIVNQFTVQAEFAQTFNRFPGTHNPYPPLNVFAAHHVTDFLVGAKYIANCFGHDVIFSGEFSQLIAGPRGSPWRRLNQIVGGISVYPLKTVKVYFEYIHTDGYAPLNFISGSHPNDPLPQGQVFSDNGAHANIGLFGVTASV